MRTLARVGSASAAPLVGLVVLLLAGCTDEKIVFREPFNPPPDETSGFVGYFTSSDKSTTCGNCHVDHQNKWEETAHSNAYETLANSGHAEDFCYSCHTVSENGNQVQAAAGWNVVEDTAYHDVQCESCHGPGVDHIETPDASAPPLARIRVLAADIASGNIDTDTATVAGSCAECHSGEHHPFVKDWASSRHARALREDTGVFIADESGSCAPCHEGRSALRAWGVTANYFERDSAPGADGPHFGVTCAVCHDPHNSQFEGQLRYSISDGTFEGNLCMKCHVRRYEPAGTSPRGPHAPQGAVLTGTAGYWPPGFDTTAFASTHGNPQANPRLCAGCHVNSFEVEDRLTGGTIFSTGHTFLPVPCLDPTTGEPSEDRSCAYDATSRYWGSCTRSGCHADASAASLALASQRADIETLARILWEDVDGDLVLYDTLATGDFGAFDAGDAGLLTQIPDPAVQINHKDRVVSIAEGALFNVRMVAEERYENADRSKGVHNPFLSTALLAASIEAVQSTYGLALRLTPEQQALLNKINAQTLRARDQRQVSSR
jgi:predicted CXXCH cytochrome family protein